MISQDFDSHLRACRPQLLRLALSITKCPLDAEDALQSASVKCFRALASFRGEAAIESWLWRAVKNEALVTLRRRKARPSLSNPYLEGSVRDLAFVGTERVYLEQHDVHTPETLLMGNELAEACHDIIQGFSVEWREALSLHMAYGHEEGYEELARRAGARPNTFKTRIARARLALREALGSRGFLQRSHGRLKGSRGRFLTREVSAGTWLWQRLGARDMAKEMAFAQS